MEVPQATKEEIAELLTGDQRDSNDLASLADLLSRSPGYKVLLQRLKDDVIRKWANEHKPEQRDQYWHSLQAVGALENTINAMIQNAKAARDRVEKVEKGIFRRRS